MSIGEQIRYFRRKSGYSMEELARAIGVSRQTVHRYENGVIGNIPHGKIERMAELFGTSASVLMGYEDPIFMLDGVHPIGERRLPLAAGATDASEGRVYALPGETVADLCFYAPDDSMAGARISLGDAVLIHICDTVRGGEIALVTFDGKMALKRVHPYPEREMLVLLSENTAYEPQVYLGEERTRVKIIGKAVALQASLR